MQTRSFVGITLPDKLRREIGKAQSELFEPGKVMKPLKSHITLLHPDMVKDSSPAELLPRIKGVSEKSLPLQVKLTKIAMFDQRVLYVAVESDNLHALFAELTEILPSKIRKKYAAGRKFEPHVTLAQAKPKQTLAPRTVEAFKKRIGPLLPQRFTAGRLDLFTRLRPRTYEISRI